MLRAFLVLTLVAGLASARQEDWLDEHTLDELERVELFEEARASGERLDDAAIDRFVGGVIFLAGRVPPEQAVDFDILGLLQRASDVAELRARGQALGELAQVRAAVLEREARWDEARDVRLGALSAGLDLEISKPMLEIGQAQAEENLGSLGQALAYAATAEESLFLGLDSAAPGFRRAYVQVLGVRAEVFVALGLLDQAQPLIREALELAEQLGEPALLAAAITRQGALLGAAQQPAALRRLLRNSLADERLKGSMRPAS